MQALTSQTDFAALLEKERAIVFIFFPWSASAVESRAVVEEWKNKMAAQPGQNSFEVSELSPDECPWAWKWLNESLLDEHEAAPVNGSVAWLKRGSVVGRVDFAAMAGTKVLARTTAACFDDKNAASHSSFNSELLQILCCPETHQKLKLAPRALIEKLNQQISAGRMQNRSGQPITDALDGGLVRADGKFLYPLRQNIPVLLVNEAIPLAGI
jgi:uncharacterized protein YbaR (Trm112 family)